MKKNCLFDIITKTINTLAVVTIAIAMVVSCCN